MHEFQKLSPDSFAKSSEMYAAALAADPDYIAARLASAYCYAHLALWQDPGTAAEYIARADDAFEVAIAADAGDARAYSIKRAVEVAKGDYASAVAAGQAGVNLDSSESASRANLAYALMCADKPDEALVQLTAAIQGIPNYPGWFALIKIHCLYMTGKLAEALREAEDTMERFPDFYPAPVMASALYAELGRREDAQRMRKRVLRVDPQFSADAYVRFQGLKSARHRDNLRAALSEAGLPE